MQRLGPTPTLLVAAILVAAGLVWLDYVVNNVWPVDPALPAAQFAELQRAVVEQRGQPTLIMRVANREAILAFLGGVVVVGMGAALPLLYFLNRRITRRRGVAGSGQPVRGRVLLRQALWVGGWLAFCTWLQMNRSLGIVVALLVGLTFGLLEVLFQVRLRQLLEESVSGGSA